MNLSDQDTDSGFFVCLNSYPACRQSVGLHPASVKPLVCLWSDTDANRPIVVVGVTVNSKCECCGEMFEHDKPKRFCSPSCRGRYNASRQKRNGKNITCPVCGKEFYIQPSYIKRGMTYCSMACKYAAMSGENSRLWKDGRTKAKLLKAKRPPKTPLPDKVCPTCKNEFAPKYPEQIYCSRGCHNNPTRMDRTCEICGKSFTAKPAEVRDGHGRLRYSA